MYNIAENSIARSQLSPYATISLDNSINRYNDVIMNLIWYFPDYVRIPKYQNEEL
jgi:hypothetical protein